MNTEALGTPEIAADRPVAALADANTHALLADQQKGSLIADRDSTPIQHTRAQKSENCAGSGSKQIKPADPKNLRLGHSDTQC
jgi:hypothetical protein